MTDEKQRNDKLAELLGKLGEQLVMIMENNNSLLKENLRLWEENSDLRKGIDERKFISGIKACRDGYFKGIPCLEMEDKWGFFPDDNDVRPGHCIWIDKLKAERLFEVFQEIK